MASAGFQSQWILSELALDYLETKSNEKYRKLAEGVVIAHIAITALYLTALKNEETGDVVAMADALQVSRDTVAIALFVRSVASNGNGRTNTANHAHRPHARTHTQNMSTHRAVRHTQ